MLKHMLLATLMLGVPVSAAGNDGRTAGKEEKPAVSSSRSGAVSFGGFWIGGGASQFRAVHPYWQRAYLPYRWYDPWYDAFYPLASFDDCAAYPGLCRTFQPTLPAGEIRLDASHENASVFINGGYAGLAKDLKSIKLSPGIYDLSVIASGRRPFEQKIYLLSGKQLKIRAHLSEKAQEQKP